MNIQASWQLLNLIKNFLSEFFRDSLKKILRDFLRILIDSS